MWTKEEARKLKEWLKKPQHLNGDLFNREGKRAADIVCLTNAGAEVFHGLHTTCTLRYKPARIVPQSEIDAAKGGE